MCTSARGEGDDDRRGIERCENTEVEGNEGEKGKTHGRTAAMQGGKESKKKRKEGE